MNYEEPMPVDVILQFQYNRGVNDGETLGLKTGFVYGLGIGFALCLISVLLLSRCRRFAPQ